MSLGQVWKGALECSTGQRSSRFGTSFDAIPS
jgi:hypothetical protein